MDQRQTIEFPYSGLDTDSDEKQMLSGDSRNRRNCINDSTDDARLGDITNPKGTTLYPHSTPPDRNVTIGSVEDTKNNATIYFVWAESQLHQIRRFFPDTGVDQLILSDPLLNFQENQKITHADIVEGDNGQLLYWTDGWFNSYMYSGTYLQFNPPRKINIDKAIAYTQGTGGYNTIDFEVLDRIKYQPPFPATLRYIYDAAQIENYVYGKIYQFTYRYIFDDKEVSTWAMLSKVLMPIYGFKNNNFYELLENLVGVTVWSGSEIVTDIEIAIRTSVPDAEGALAYFVVSRLNKADLGINDNTNYEYSYDGIAYKENLQATSFLRPYDYVPQISGAQEIASGRMTDADVIEGYDLVDTNMSAEFIRYDKTLSIRDTSPDPGNPSGPNANPWGTGGLSFEYPIPNFKHLGVYQWGIKYYDRAGRSGFVNTKDEYTMLVPSYDEGIVNPFAGILMDPLKLRYQINHQPPSWAAYWAPVITKELSYLKKQQILITEKDFDFATGKLKLPISSGYTFTAKDKVRLLGYSKAPVNFLLTSLGITIDGTITFDDIFSYNDFVANGFSFPPSNYGNSLLTQAVNEFNYEIQEYDSGTGEISFSKVDTQSAKNYFDNHGTGTLDIIPASYFYIIEIYNTERNSTENKVFFEIGDKFEVGDAHLSTRYHKGPVQDQIPNVQPAIGDIYGFDCYLRRKSSVLDNYPILLKGADGAGTIGSNIYLTFPESFLPYFKDSDLSDVTTIDWDLIPPGTLGNYHINLHLGFTEPEISSTMFVFHTIIKQQNGTYTPDPTKPFVYGIVFKSQLELFPWLEVDNFADDYVSQIYSDGRVDTNLSTAKRQEMEARLRWGGTLFENTDVNELSTFLFDSYTDLSQVYGPISKIFQMGDTLKVRQKNKMTSFYLNRQVYQDSEGNDQVVQSNQFLSVPNVYEEPYGTTLAGADSKSTRISYFFDLIRGQIIRDAGNTPIPISGDEKNPKDVFKMSKYFRDLAKNIRTIGEENFNIHSCWDDFSQLYTLTVQDLREGAPLSQTIVFHEPSNRWKSSMDYVPEWYATVGKYVIMFKDSQPYIAYSNNLRCNFLGVQYDQEMDFVVNLGRNTPKVFENIDLCSNVAWEVTDVNILPTPNYPNGMSSRIPKGKFVAKEGVWHAQFLRDKNDPKYASNAINGLLNGRRLRGQTMKVTMTNNQTDLVYLQAINIYVTPSELII